MAKKFDEVRIPFTKMTFSPDVPSTALGPMEYNDGKNVETDVRGIRSVAGDEEILETLTEVPTFVTGNFRRDGKFWFVVVCENGGIYANDGDGSGWENISPVGRVLGPDFYAQNTNVTEAWNGTVLFLNDAKTAPMFWPEAVEGVPTAPLMIQYSQQIPLDVTDIYPLSLTVQRVEFSSSFPITTATPFVAGETIELTGVQPRYFNGIYTVDSNAVVVPGETFGYVDILCSVTDAYSSSGLIAPQYSWNYDNQWKGVFANFMRMYNSPNVGSILVAGNLTATLLDDTVANFPVTVQWSQAFGLNQAPTTWTPTVTNVANQLEVPLRGPALDAFPCNGQFFLCSYWDTVVFSPINYSTTSTPILGVRLFNQGRGILSSSCWANTDKSVYGVDARDVWVFDGNDFQGIGNQRVKNWFYDQIDAEYYDRIYMEINTQKNQVEIYYPDSTATNGVPNKMLSYRYDLDVWNAPREVAGATFACESPIWLNQTDSSLPEWYSNNASRTVVYARGFDNAKLIQKDQGYSWYDDAPIASEFIRENIKMLPEYSGKLLVHRILPEVVNMGANPDSERDELPIDPADPAYDDNKGNVTITVGGALSVGSSNIEQIAVTMPIDTDDPWVQINQNSSRVNKIKIANTSNTNIWMCSATTWQYTQTEDDR